MRKNGRKNSCPNWCQGICTYAVYKLPAEEIRSRLKIPQRTLVYLHSLGRLQAALDTGTVTRKVNKSQYRDRYGFTLMELAGRLNLNSRTIIRWHHSGKLEKTLKEFPDLVLDTPNESVIMA